MAKQLKDIITTFSLLSYEERLAIVKRIRKNKYEVRPAMQKIKKKASAKKSKVGNKKIQELLKGMSPEQIAGVLANLGESNE